MFRRYKRHFKLQTRQGLNKVQLLDSVNRHFRSIHVNEKETLAFFIFMVKMNKNRVDKENSGNQSDDDRRDTK